jgi:hypothetical protein
MTNNELISHKAYRDKSIPPKNKLSPIYLGKILPFTILILAICLQACSPTDPPLMSFEPTQPVDTQEPIEIEPLATVTFQVDVPPNTPPDQPILFSILDEVTGLALNITRQEMQKTGDHTYAITLPFPVGANIKYRYARGESYTVEEHTTNGQPVRYRLYRVDGPGIVQDVISTWSDTTFNGTTGRIMGQVKDNQVGIPIPNLLVTAGGAQTVTSSNGEFLLEGLPPGIHNLVVYAFDGSYPTFQQGAKVAENSTTPSVIDISPAPLVKLIFIVTAPEGTLPAVPIRLAGNLYQLGNTFSNLSGGVNNLSSRMPTLTPLPDGRYALEIELPAGAFLEYKYTLGDGFWNSEHTPSGDFKLRTMTVPEINSIVEDHIDNWGDTSAAGPILFNLTIPSSTPDYDFISIQFNPFGWTEPIPMWDLGDNNWVYMLYSPLTNQENFIYRYCRNDQCGRADDALTPGYDTPGRSISISGGTQTIDDVVENWQWLQPGLSPDLPEMPDVNPRPEEFIAGIELGSYYHPSLTPRLPVTFREIESMHANWIFLTPTWTFTRQSPPVLEPVTGKDFSWYDLSNATEKSRAFGMQIALNPAANFPLDSDEWWHSAPRDFPWWQVWFERYRNFILNFADKAGQDSVNGLVIGGEWISPALPDGLLPDGSPSGVPADAETRWRDLIVEVRERFEGTLFWALPATKNGIDPPAFIEDLDQVYLIWSLPLTDKSEASYGELSEAAAQFMDSEVFPLKITLEMPTLVAAAYPSAKGGLQGCIQIPEIDNQSTCLNLEYLEPGFEDNPTIEHDLEGQLSAYQALLLAINERDWIDGVVSQGFYPPAELQDKSSSIHGKPAQDIVRNWYSQLILDTPSSE